MRILADENMPAVAELFGDLSANIITAPGRTLTPQQVAQTDVLLVRSVTSVNAELLAESAVQFVGSATIGTDHIDLAALQARHIPFAHAPGCNADAVVNYVLAALLHVFAVSPDDIAHKTVSVIGAGNVGGRLVRQLRTLGLTVQVYDPPRAQREGLESERFVDLPTALSADVVCCHTPLTRSGDFPTAGMLTASSLADLPRNAVFLNAGRGGLVRAHELQAAMDQLPDVRWLLDVWDPEPVIPKACLARATLATGHIAGHSSEGKVRGTCMLRQALAEQLNVRASAKTLEDLLPEAPTVTVDSPADTPWHTAAAVVRQVYDIAADDARFRRAMVAPDHGRAFDEYRRSYPTRREFQSTTLINALHLPAEHQTVLQAMGFKLA